MGGMLPETKAQEQVLRARRDLRAESKEPGGVPNEPTEDRDVCKISLADLEIAAESLTAGSFKEVFFARYTFFQYTPNCLCFLSTHAYLSTMPAGVFTGLTSLRFVGI